MGRIDRKVGIKKSVSPGANQRRTSSDRATGRKREREGERGLVHLNESHR